MHSLHLPGRSGCCLGAALAVGLLSPQARAQDPVHLLLGPPGGFGDVWSAASAGGVAMPVPGLEDLRMLPLDAAGRTESEEFLPDRARARFDLPGASRLVLPAGHGSLYRFERAAIPGASSASFGFLLVEPGGLARVLHERAGAGALGSNDPWLATVAVEPGGAAFLAATTVESGGDLIEIQLDGTVHERTAALAAQPWAPHGLLLRSTWGSAAHPTGVWRFDRTPGAQADTVTLPGMPPWCAAELVASGDGQRAAVAAGASAQAASVYVYGPVGEGIQVQALPQWMTPAGFAPQYTGGPFLALSQDGAQVAWCTDGLKWEAWLAHVPTSAPTTPIQISADGVFLDTLDGVGPFWFRSDGRLQISIGEKADPLLGGIEGLDVYEILLPATGAPTITNLTLTNGSAAPPYLQKSSIDPDYLRRVPGSDDFLFQGRIGALDQLARLGPAGVQPLLANIKATQAVEFSGGAFLMGLESGAGVDPTLVVRLVTQGLGAWTPAVVASLPSGVLLERATGDGAGRAAVVIDWLGDEWVATVDALTGASALLFPFPFVYGPALDFSIAGGLALSTGPTGAPALFGSWAPASAAQLYATPLAAGQILPAR